MRVKGGGGGRTRLRMHSRHTGVHAVLARMHGGARVYLSVSPPIEEPAVLILPGLMMPSWCRILLTPM